MLTATACDGSGFSVVGERPIVDVFPHERTRVSYSAFASERRGPVLIEHSVTAFAEPKSFVFDEALTTASVQPPPPFHGAAALHRDASGSIEWSGSLSVSVPGRSVHLAGPDFKARIESFPFSLGAAFIVTVVRPCRSEL